MSDVQSRTVRHLHRRIRLAFGYEVGKWDIRGSGKKRYCASLSKGIMQRGVFDELLFELAQFGENMVRRPAFDLLALNPRHQGFSCPHGISTAICQNGDDLEVSVAGEAEGANHDEGAGVGDGCQLCSTPRAYISVFM